MSVRQDPRFSFHAFLSASHAYPLLCPLSRLCLDCRHSGNLCRRNPRALLIQQSPLNSYLQRYLSLHNHFNTHTSKLHRPRRPSSPLTPPQSQKKLTPQPHRHPTSGTSPTASRRQIFVRRPEAFSKETLWRC